jgi:hypothetical protein
MQQAFTFNFNRTHQSRAIQQLTLFRALRTTISQHLSSTLFPSLGLQRHHKPKSRKSTSSPRYTPHQTQQPQHQPVPILGYKPVSYRPHNTKTVHS